MHLDKTISVYRKSFAGTVTVYPIGGMIAIWKWEGRYGRMITVVTWLVPDGQVWQSMDFRWGAACFDSYERIMILYEE